MERHSEGIGNALQLVYGRVSPATTYAVKILLRPAYPSGQFRFAHVFFNMAFFKSIFVSRFIVVFLKYGYTIRLPRCFLQEGALLFGLGGYGRPIFTCYFSLTFFQDFFYLVCRQLLAATGGDDG